MPTTEFPTGMPTVPHSPSGPPAGAKPPMGPGGTAATSVPASGSIWSLIGDRIDAAVGFLRGSAEAIASVGHGRIMFEMAEVVAATRQPEQVEAALVRLAGSMAGACRVELWLDRDERVHPEPRLIALWCESPEPMTEEEIDALGYPLALGLSCGEHYRMTLEIYAATANAKKRWTRRLVRRLTALCALAAAAERGLHVSQRNRFDAPTGTNPAVRDATFLNAVLPYALAQAHRHREPLTAVCVEVDNLGTVYRKYGPEAAGAAVRRIAEAIARGLRASDVVARLDDDRVIAIFPNTGGAATLHVAEVIRAAIAGACKPTPAIPDLTLTVSLGVAGFPTDANDMLSLLSAADEAVARAKACGGDQIACATPQAPIAAYGLPEEAGLRTAS